MIADLFKSNVVEVVEESIDADSQSGKLVLRVREEKPWIRMMQELVVAANVDDSVFGLEVHKVFHRADAGVQFTWVVILWGDPGSVRPALAPILARNAAAPPPFALGKAGTRPAATPRAPSSPRTQPAPAQEDDEGPPEPELRLGLRDGKHNIKKVEDVDNGVIDKRTTISLAHARGNRFMRNQNPHETVNLETGRGKFKAVVQGRGESEFSYRRDGGGSAL